MLATMRPQSNASNGFDIAESQKVSKILSFREARIYGKYTVNNIFSLHFCFRAYKNENIIYGIF